MDKKNTSTIQFPPVVTVLGHVDHGKTSLLDAIRKTNIVDREFGGITQKIGASEIEIMHDGVKRRITFIDTPGHEAFAKMRSRGALAADIGLLIVSSADGVMPQTRESIQLLKTSKLPYIVVLTKSDLEAKIVEKVKGQLVKEEVNIEGYGGDIPVIEVSSKTGHNIKELLDLILLMQDMLAATDVSPSAPLKAVVIESKLDQKVGPKATIVVKNGTLKLRDEIVCEDVSGKARTLLNSSGKQVSEITIGDAVEILGFEKVPQIGALVKRKGEAELVVKKQQSATNGAIQFIDTDKVALIVCADTAGSLEAILNSLPLEKLSLVAQKTGEISEADILLAKSTKAIVVGFNVKVRPDVATLARTEKVLAKNYTIIYELIGEISDVMEGKALSLEEKIYGTAKILASFPFEKTKVMGIKVLEGRIAKGDKIRIIRGEDQLVGETTVQSVRQLKNIVSKIEKGQEGGVTMSPFLDFTIGDMIISHE